MIRDRTKRMFAAELEEMLGAMPLEKVRVKDLCERCGVQRQLFYYHFKDKYDLVAWIFVDDLHEGHRRAGRVSYCERTAAALENMWGRRRFYRVAFSDKSQNSIESYIQEFDVRMSSATVRKHAGLSSLSDQQMFDIKHQSYGSIGCIIEWLKGDLKMSANQFAAWEFSRMPAFLAEAFDDADALSY